jgi:ATP-dependent DNA helicase PIF1
MDTFDKFRDLIEEYNVDIGANDINMIKLSPDQAKALETFKSGKNLLVIGAGGCGKSRFIKELERYVVRETSKNIVISATTGVASSNVQGVTINSFMGIGNGDADIDVLLKRVLRKRAIVDRLRTTDVLIIDEFSMMSAELFEKINKVFQAVYKNRKAFGGVQVVLTGDLCQLLPVFNKNQNLYADQDTRIVFESKVFSEMFNKKKENIINLTTNFRQDDKDFVQMLLRIRSGDHTAADIELLLKRLITNNALHDTTHLVVSNKKAHDINIKNLNQINKPAHFYAAIFNEHGDPDVCKELRGDLHSQFLQKGVVNTELKVGARVMLIKNLVVESGLVNGSTGTIASFDNGFPTVQFDNGIKQLIGLAEWKLEFGNSHVIVRQVPLMLAWASTIHKAQGITLEKATIDLCDAFCDGHVYVALSRVKSINGLYLKSFDPTRIIVSEKVKEYLKSI